MKLMFDRGNIGFFFLYSSNKLGVEILTMPGQDKKNQHLTNIDAPKRLDDRQRKQMQHELKIYMEQYFKKKLGKGVDYTKIVIWEDMLIIRGERFLTEPEMYIVETPAGKEVVRAARMQVARQHSIDNVPYFEELFQARCIHQTYDIEPENDFWWHIAIFDRMLTE